MRSRGLVLQCLEAMSSTDEKTLRFAMDDFLDNFGKDVEIGQASRRKLLQRYARVFSRLQNVRSTKRFPELHAAMATAAGEHSSPELSPFSEIAFIVLQQGGPTSNSKT